MLFLKPTLKKVLFSVILLIIAIFFLIPIMKVQCIGFCPLLGIPPLTVSQDLLITHPEFYSSYVFDPELMLTTPNFYVSLIFSYLLSCFVFVFGKLKKEVKRKLSFFFFGLVFIIVFFLPLLEINCDNDSCTNINSPFNLLQEKYSDNLTIADYLQSIDDTKQLSIEFNFQPVYTFPSYYLRPFIIYLLIWELFILLLVLNKEKKNTKNQDNK